MSPTVKELAAAVADGEAVDWEAVRAGADAPDPIVANLQLLDRVASASGAKRLRGDESRRIRLSGTLALWEGGLLLIAVLRALLAIVGTLWQMPSTGRDLLLAQLSVAASCLVAGLVLIRGSEGDRRAVALGGILLTGAGATAWPHYRHLFPEPSGPWFDPLAIFLPEALIAYWIWSFVSVFPRRVIAGYGDWVFTLGKRASLAWGLVLLTAQIARGLGPGLRPSLHFLARTGTNFWFWGVIGLLSLAALPAMLLAARRAAPSERQRATFFLIAIACGFVPLFLIEVIAILTGETQASSLDLALELLPGLTVPFTTAYGVLAKRMLPLRALFHETTRYLLARTTVGMVVTLPVVAIGLILLVERDRPVGEALNGNVLAGLLGASLILAPFAMYRRQLILRLDRLFNRELQDWHGHLARLSRALAGTTTTLLAMEALDLHVARPLGAGSVELFRLTSDGRTYTPSRAGASPLDSAAGPALLAFDSDQLLMVDPSDDSSAFWWFPESDRRWILDADAGLLLPLTIGEKPSGLLVLGPRRAGRAYEPEEVQFLVAVAATTAAAVERLAVEPPEAPKPAFECEECGLLRDTQSACACGGPVVEARVPRLLAGRYEVLNRVGEGAMGRVYYATDLDLSRRVALKTLPAVSSEASVRLRQEARAMAGVIHPNLAVLYGIERWNGAPVLVEEFMTGGTLSDRLAKPMEIAEVVRLGRALSSALEALHRAGFVHRDVKPSNIGYSELDEPKLLDLGLAEAGVRAHEAPSLSGDGSASLLSFAGTPRYAPPEAWRGQRVGPEGDLWALAMVLYECVTGEHPLAGVPSRGWVEVMGTLPAPEGPRQPCPHWLSTLIADGLSTDPDLRWRSATRVRAYLGSNSV